MDFDIPQDSCGATGLLKDGTTSRSPYTGRAVHQLGGGGLALDEAFNNPRPMVLPAVNETVPLERIRVICEHYGLRELWRKIETDPPRKPFVSDGCTGWFNEWKGVSIYAPCFLHDLKYWAGYPGEEVERLVADAELMIDVARALGGTNMAELMFRGVRIGGQEGFRASFSWGFGRVVG